MRTGLEFLPTAFHSIADQCADVEVALLDASGDKVVAALAEQSGLHFHHRYHRASDDGQAAAIQVGWDHGTGEYLGWLNADDRLLPGALDTVAATFAAHPEADVVYGQACYLDENGAFLGYFPAFEPSPDRLPWSNMICQPAAFLRRSSLARIGGLNTSLHYTMDWDLWLRLYQAGCHFHAIDTVLAAVVNRAESKTNTGRKIRQREISAILKRQAQQAVGLREYFGRLYGEAALGGHSLIWRLITTGLALRRSLLGRKAAALPAYRRGITPLSNEIQQQCDIVMPVPGHNQNVRLHLFSDRPGSFSISPRVNGADADHPAVLTRPMILNGRRQRSGFGGTYHAYHYVGQPIPTAAGLLSITLLGPKLWRLIAIEAEPTDAV
ncbi:glycosyltransferase [Ferrovibrio sp.]|uniref:glycosyltransferase n=1 Tax=Ferrovibrio sp. TaxID=1917215 RepID=UPI001B64E3C4|nr:glycosyltransferase [Ferrovibrio sp.]MBP7066381.1 glycosyltransferase [Ferrovibrio sp.]